MGGLGDDPLACLPVDWLAQLSCEAWPSLPLISVESGGAADFFFFLSVKGKLDVYPLLPQEVPVAVAVLTGLLAF